MLISCTIVKRYENELTGKPEVQVFKLGSSVFLIDSDGSKGMQIWNLTHNYFMATQLGGMSRGLHCLRSAR